MSLFALASSVPMVACAMAEDPESSQVAQQAKAQTMEQLEKTPIETPVVPEPARGNPFAGAELYVDPQSLAMLRANALRATEPEKAQVLDRIAQQPMALWMGGWNPDIYRAVDHFVGRAHQARSLPVMIAYNIPLRDCGGHSQGGLETKVEYQRWIRKVHRGIAERSAAVILEPDALGHFQECLSDQQKADRMLALRDAVLVLRQNPSTAVYLDAGHARWVPAEDMAERLLEAGIEHAHGFALNVSNYVTTEENLTYGHRLSSLVGGKPFVIDTSRNGAGPYEQARSVEETWCNPKGRKIGRTPTTETGDELCQAFLWLKRPGESDGRCGGGPPAGHFWLERALEMAAR